MKRFTVWSGFAGVLLSYTIGAGCSSSDPKPGGSGSGGDSSDGGSTQTGGSNSSTGATTGSGGATGGSSSGTGGEEMGGGGLGGLGGGAGAGPVNYLENPGFEEGSTDKLAEIPGWEEDGDLVASYLETGGARTGAQRLGHWMEWEMDGDWYEVSTFQTVTSIPNGTYTFSVWVMRDEWFDEQYLFARDYGDAEMTQSTFEDFSDSQYVQVQLSGIEVTNNQVTVGIYSAAPAGVWANFDDASLVRE